MNDLILDHTILQATVFDLWPIQQKGGPSLPACIELAYGSGLFKLIHAAMPDWLMVTPEHIRIAAPEAMNMTLFRKELAVGGSLRSALVNLRCAAIVDRGILAECVKVRQALQSLAGQQPVGRALEDEDHDFDNPVMKPYDRWWYAIERNGNEPVSGTPQVLAIPISHVNRAREPNPKLAIDELYDILEDGHSPVMAKIGVPKSSSDYPEARAEWIEIAIESLVANIEEAVKGWPVLPGEPFQNVVMIDDHLFFITIDTIDGVTVASPTASKQALEQFTVEVHRVGHAHLAHGLAALRRAETSRWGA